MASNIARFPGGSRGPLVGGTSGGDMGPGFRRDSGTGSVSSRGVGHPAGVELAMTPCEDNFFLGRLFEQRLGGFRPSGDMREAAPSPPDRLVRGYEAIEQRGIGMPVRDHAGFG